MTLLMSPVNTTNYNNSDDDDDDVDFDDDVEDVAPSGKTSFTCVRY